MPKRVAKEAKRVPLNCLVLPETLAYLKSSIASQGVAVDMAVAALKMQQTQGRVMAETGDPWKAVAVNPKTSQSWKRGPGPKGDKTR